MRFEQWKISEDSIKGITHVPESMIQTDLIKDVIGYQVPGIFFALLIVALIWMTKKAFSSEESRVSDAKAALPLFGEMKQLFEQINKKLK